MFGIAAGSPTFTNNNKKLIIQHQSIKASNAKKIILFYFLNSWDDYKSDLISCDSNWSVRDLPTIW